MRSLLFEQSDSVSDPMRSNVDVTLPNSGVLGIWPSSQSKQRFSLSENRYSVKEISLTAGLTLAEFALTISI
jgi:hypothetical protein